MTTGGWVRKLSHAFKFAAHAFHTWHSTKAQFFHAAIACNAIVTQSVSCDLIDERQNHRIERYTPIPAIG